MIKIELAEKMSKSGEINFSDLDGKEGEILIDETTEIEEVQKGFLDMSNLSTADYPTLDQWAAWMRENFKEKTVNIPTTSLNVNGRVVGDSFESYLTKNRFRINDDGTVSGYLQSSDLKAANKTPRHLLFKIISDDQKAETKEVINRLHEKKNGESKAHFEFGEAMHACILEPTRFSRYVVEPQASTASHEGCDTLIDFWNSMLIQKFIKESSSTVDGTKEYRAAIEIMVSEGGYFRKETLKGVLQQAHQRLVDEKSQIKEGHRFNNLVSDLERVKLGLDNYPSKVIDEVCKQLGLKKNEALGESKKEEFSCDPKISLIDAFVSQIKLEIEKIGKVDSTDILFRSLQEKKYLIESLKIACDLESVSEEQFAVIKALELNYRQYGGGILPRLIKHSKRENSIYCDDFDGLPLKVRPDAMAFEENVGLDMIISVKSTRSENIEKFFYDTAKLQYHTSEGMYQEVASAVTGREFRTTVTIMFQTVEPYGVAAIFWKPEDLAIGSYRFKQAHEVTKQTLEAGLWPGYDIHAEPGNFGMIESNLPWWTFKEMMPTNIED